MFLLADCNNFYASCEEAFNPNLKRAPLVILSSQEGCAIALSKKAKALGITVGMRAYELERFIRSHNLYTLSANFPLYADMSARVMDLLSSLGDEMEVYSIDEAFFSRNADSKETLLAQARQVRDQVLLGTGIPVSIGIARTKTLAKLASREAKRQEGIYYLEHPESLLATTSLEQIWGIGSKTALHLRRNGIYTPLQLTRSPDSKIQQLWGLQGLKVAQELRGIPCSSSVDREEAPRQSILCSRTFAKLESEVSSLLEAAATFTARTAEKLREQGSLASRISLFLSAKAGFGESLHASSTFPLPTAYTPELIESAQNLVRRLHRNGDGFRRMGILLTDLSPQSERQLDLWIARDEEKREALMKTLDQIRARYQLSSLRFASEGWVETRKRDLSPRYTTSWKELLRVHAS